MARTILIVLLIVALNIITGCARVDTGNAQLVPAGATTAVTPPLKVAGAGEADIVEQLAVNRQAYRQGLEALVQYYLKKGDNMKLAWAEKELAALDEMPKYNYIIEAAMAPARLKASTLISGADALYNEALQLETEASTLMVIKNDNLLRLALDKYNQVIKDFPTSDKIDDAAWHAAGIYEHFKDYSIAALYYQRVYEWDPTTAYPAKFKAAYILDINLHRRGEALELYKQAVESLSRASEHRQWKEYAERRIAEISKSGEKIQ